MAIKDEIIEFVKEAEYQIALDNKLLQKYEDLGKRNSPKYVAALQRMHELSMIADMMLVSNIEIYDNDDAIVVNFTQKTDVELRQFMSDMRVYYRLKLSPYADLPFIVTPYITGTSAGDESSIPAGGLPDWYLTHNVAGDLIWKELSSVIDGGEL